MRISNGLLSLIAFLCTLPSAHAYDLEDHKRITLQAVAEFNACFPGLIKASQSSTLRASDVEEDVDFIRKDFLYSHFYNPYKHLDMLRYDSSVRVSRLQAALGAEESQGDFDGFDVFVHLGHAVHHLQDMSVPPHVVPVMHWLDDGFEKYDLSGEISSGLSCADLAVQPVTDLNHLLVDTAKQTLDHVANIDLEIKVGPRLIPIGGDAFWKESSDDSFGGYGFLGNHFGQASFSQGGADYSVPVDFYATFKQAQMKLGTRSTLEALYWFLIWRR